MKTQLSTFTQKVTERSREATFKLSTFKLSTFTLVTFTLLTFLLSAQTSEIPFKGANQIIIQDTNLKAFGQHLVNCGYDIQDYWPEFNTFSTGYMSTSKMNFAYRFHVVKNDSSLVCRIFLKRYASQLNSLNETGSIPWEYRESTANAYGIIYEDIKIPLLKYRKKVLFREN